VAESKDDSKGTPPDLARLPPGRHGLPREFVVKNQRDRLTAGMIAVVADRGYNDVTITDIAAAAGVSRRTFYTYFSSKEECFFATYDLIAAHLLEVASAAAAAEKQWPRQVRAAIAAALALFAANSDLARFMLVAPPRGGEPISGRYQLSAERALAQLTHGMPTDVAAPSPAIQNALIGGLAGLIAHQVEVGDGEDLPALLPELVELFLTPYVGRQEASRAAHED
jgi:AcrR family transcriptional regulator